MKPAQLDPGPSDRGSLKAIPSENTIIARPPFPVAVAPPPSSSPRDLATGSPRPTSAPDAPVPVSKARSRLYDDLRRDSGLAASSLTAKDSRTTLATDVESSGSLVHSSSVLPMTTEDRRAASLYNSSEEGVPRMQASNGYEREPLASETPFLGITTAIPNGGFEDLTSPGQLEFSKRGSMLIGGKKANHVKKSLNGPKIDGGSWRQPSNSLLLPSHSMRIPSRVLSADDEILSQKVRSMYECGYDEETSWSAGRFSRSGSGMKSEETAPTADSFRTPSRYEDTLLSQEMRDMTSRDFSQPTTVDSRRESSIQREETELAGGIEDWENVNGGDVDRYGFIVPRRLASRAPRPNSPRPASPEPPRLQRVSTLLLLASEAPRAQRSALKRSPSGKVSTRAATTSFPLRKASSTSLKTPSSRGSDKGSYQGNVSGSNPRIRSTTNRLPYNRTRRCMDEAGDMLTLPPGLADIAEHEEGGKVANGLKRKEWEREEKWRRMAKMVGKNKNGGGMLFEFDTKNPKLIERTWKGIPDRWRATAWHAFLTANAKRKKGSPSDDELIESFRLLLVQSSPDDVQIDIDVPRTINSHIMFRRRYRGGQRLLFRVLHALSIYFPDTGYVQGMAALAATLLCYFDEEMTFVMLVRLWQLRGLERLYQSGFEGLMQALEEFEKTWLGDSEVATKLVGHSSHCIHFYGSKDLISGRPSSAYPRRHMARAGT